MSKELLPLSEDERNKVIEEISLWKQQEITENTDFEEFIGEVQSLDDDELIKRWKNTVGRWVLSRKDIINNYGEKPADLILKEILQELLSDVEETPYGFSI